MIYILTFLEGIASFISPCILPMIPIYVSYFVGKNTEKTSKAITNAIGFVFGFTIVFLTLSIFASSVGSVLNKYIQYIKVLFGIVIIILGLNYMDIVKIKFLNMRKQIKADIKDFNFIKALVFGILFSASWTPCVGTFLSSALLLIAKEQNVFKGILLIIIYSIGLGIPFIISVAFIEKLKKLFNVIKNNYQKIKVVSGAILIIMGIYMIIF